MDVCLGEESTGIQTDLSLQTEGESQHTAQITGGDEVEELSNSLKKIVDNQDVQPKMQCIMVDPSFSMVTVQSEESSIVWDTTGSRCSSEAGMAPEVHSKESLGTSGKVIFIMDEGKVQRKPNGDKGKQGKKSAEVACRRTTEDIPSGAERLAMTEVSVPNIKPETGPLDPEEQKELNLFNIVSEGSEILNIVAPPDISMVDEEESLEMADNLFYLEHNPNIKSSEIPEVFEDLELYRFDESEEPNADPSLTHAELDDVQTAISPAHSIAKKVGRGGTSGVDYFEKFTLLDEQSPSDLSSGTGEEPQEHHNKMKASEKPQQVKANTVPSEGHETLFSEAEVEIPGEQIDEVFYGSSCLEDEPESADEKDLKHLQCPLKEKGSELFKSEETILLPIFLSPGPPKIIDPVLLEEPTAMAFLYSDLYADAVGSRKRDEDGSELESVLSDRSYQRRLSDSEDSDGYFEKFILKDETPVVEGGSSVERRRGDAVRMEELMGALTPVPVLEIDEDKLCEMISVLQRKSEEIEDFMPEMDVTYKLLEEFCQSNAQSESPEKKETMKKVTELYEEMSKSVDEHKRAKQELVKDHFGAIKKCLQSAKEVLEKSRKTAEEPGASPKDPHQSSVRGLEDFSRKGGAVKDELQVHTPVLQCQEASSASSTSVSICWKVTEGDTVDYFQVFWRDSKEATPEQSVVIVKEISCILEGLGPDRSYDVWLTAVNQTGCSLPSEKLPFRTAPSAPVISTKQCTVLWDSATIRWSSACPSSVETYTLEYCQQSTSQGQGLKTIAGIKTCEQSVSLQPSENYLFYVKAANQAGASEQSEGALISTRGTRFYLLKDTADAVLEISEDKSTVRYPAATTTPKSTKKFPAVRGELLPGRGQYYWETAVADSESYRMGVACQTSPRSSPLGENRSSWCISCSRTATSLRYELLHNNERTGISVTGVPTKVGTLLDYTGGQLSFFNPQSGQLLGSYRHKFTEDCHAVFALDKPGSLVLQPAAELPKFVK